jgi:hypothetical protein
LEFSRIIPSQQTEKMFRFSTAQVVTMGLTQRNSFSKNLQLRRNASTSKNVRILITGALGQVN